MSAPAAAPILAALRSALDFRPGGEPAGNVTVGTGSLDACPVRVALVENRTASGAIGRLEAERLAAMLRVAAGERAPVVLFLDSAGAKVSEGLAALGAFRHLYRAGLDAALAGVPIAAVLGRNCYGGSSMLAHLAGRRLFAPETRLAMSGPAILAAGAGMSAIDEAFRAMAEAAMSARMRAAASPDNSVWEPGSEIGTWLRAALQPLADPAARYRARHEALASRLGAADGHPPREAVRRRDLGKLYPDGYEAHEADGFLEGRGRRAGREERFLGLVGASPLGIARAWRFAEAAWRMEEGGPLEVYLDCATHAARLEDEKAVLTEYVVDMAFALAACAARGARVGLTVLGKAGGGVYVALAAPAARTTSTPEADIQVLPGSAVAAILGESREAIPSFDDYRAAGVAEDERKLGLAP